MRIDILFLAITYIFSQYFRSFLSVLTPELSTDINATPSDFSNALAWWFLAFALMQFPVGWALDRIGPRLTVSVLFIFTAIGMLFFTYAQKPSDMYIAMTLVGIGCSPVLMSSYFIFAHEFSAKIFATMAGLFVGFGMIGNIVSSAPTDWAIDIFGWRNILFTLAFISASISGALFCLVRNPKIIAEHGDDSIWDIFKIRALWVILPLFIFHYAPLAGIRGAWIGTYLTDVFAAAHLIGYASFLMAMGMIIGTIGFGPLDRIFKTRKKIVIYANIIMVLALLILAFAPSYNATLSIALFVMVGFSGSTYPLLVAHARAFLPSHLIGRGMTTINLCSIGGVGVMQILSSKIYDTTQILYNANDTISYSYVFFLFALTIIMGSFIYSFSKDRLD